MSMKPLDAPPKIKEGDDRINAPDDHVPVVSEDELEDAEDLDDDDYDDNDA